MGSLWITFVSEQINPPLVTQIFLVTSYVSVFTTLTVFFVKRNLKFTLNLPVYLSSIYVMFVTLTLVVPLNLIYTSLTSPSFFYSSLFFHYILVVYSLLICLYLFF